MNTDNPKPSYGEQVAAALARARTLHRPQPRPEFVAYVNSLDAMELNIAQYLLHDLQISSFVIPKLLPLIDQRWFIDRLESEVSFTLKELEDLEKGNSAPE